MIVTREWRIRCADGSDLHAQTGPGVYDRVSADRARVAADKHCPRAPHTLVTRTTTIGEWEPVPE